MFELKQLSSQGVNRALEKAERYRLLNEPWQAESICRDVLTVEPANQRALTTLLLAITDQFRTEGVQRTEEANSIVAQLTDNYARTYYSGIVCERHGTAYLQRDISGAGQIAYEWLRRAMTWYEKAEALRPAGNDDALLRWNTCVRVIQRRGDVRAAPEQDMPLPLE